MTTSTTLARVGRIGFLVVAVPTLFIALTPAFAFTWFKLFELVFD